MSLKWQRYCEPCGGRYSYKVKKDFFKIWSHDMARVLGFIAADGCVCPANGGSSVRLIIESTDLEYLEALKEVLGSGLTVATHGKLEERGKQCYEIRIAELDFIKDLMNKGICLGKSKSLGPMKIPGKYFWDFLCGYTDGDGCLGIYQGRPTISWTSSAKSYLEWLRVELNEKGFKRKTLYERVDLRHRRASVYWSLRYTGAMAAKVVRKIYGCSGLKMARKYKMALQIMGLQGEI